MFVPTRRLVVFALLPVPGLVLLSGAVIPWTLAALVAFAYDLVLLVVVVLDLVVSARTAQVQVRRELPAHLSVGAHQRLGWTVSNRARHDVELELVDDLPESIERSSIIVTARIAAQSTATVQYTARPTRRGRVELGDVHLRVRSLLGLVQRQARLPRNDELKVYPNVKGLVRHELAARRHRLSEIGLMPVRRRGAGTTFESLREYVPGDDPSEIAWKATARRGRLITRTWEMERSQNVVVVLDCGRLMTTKIDELTRLDHAINATLLLSYVTMKQGDYIGLLAFSDRIESYVPPMRGHAALRRMNDALYHLEPRLREPSYERACGFLALKHRKRSLIVIVTDVIDADASSALLAYAARFSRHHLPLCVTLRNLEIERLAHARPVDTDGVFAQAVALDQLERRQQALHRMRRFGVDVLDVDPRQLGPRLISRYLTLKQRAL
jgi:uncharacterized protein (DUF58 family)